MFSGSDAASYITGITVPVDGGQDYVRKITSDRGTGEDIRMTWLPAVVGAEEGHNGQG